MFGACIVMEIVMLSKKVKEGINKVILVCMHGIDMQASG